MEGKDAAHVGLIKDPGDLKTMKRPAECHPEEARRVKHSAMALAPRMINHTRFAFGGQKSPQPTYATTDAGSLKRVPHPADSANLGDDLLSACLRYHLHEGFRTLGEHRVWDALHATLRTPTPRTESPVPTLWFGTQDYRFEMPHPTTWGRLRTVGKGFPTGL
jgi:hypothetical protein